jgi:hypothetical protein
MCLARFVKLTYARTDHSIINVPLEETESIHKKCDLAFYKVLMIRLRRRNNAEEWQLFKKFTEENKSYILDNFNLRWLLSVVDTYADCGEPLEKSNAMLVDSFMTNEKLRQTEKCIFDFVEKPADKKDFIRHIDSLYSVNLGAGDDTVNNYFKRVFDCLKETPVLYAIFLKYMEFAWENDTVFAALTPHYGYIKWGYTAYKGTL